MERVTGQKYSEAVPVICGCATTLLRHLPRKEVLSHDQSVMLGMHVPAHGWAEGRRVDRRAALGLHELPVQGQAHRRDSKC